MGWEYATFVVMRLGDRFTSLAVARTGWVECRHPMECRRLKVALLTLLAYGLMAACFIHAEPPYVTAAEAKFDDLERYWFMATERGRCSSTEGYEVVTRLRRSDPATRNDWELFLQKNGHVPYSDPIEAELCFSPLRSGLVH